MPTFAAYSTSTRETEACALALCGGFFGSRQAGLSTQEESEKVLNYGASGPIHSALLWFNTRMLHHATRLQSNLRRVPAIVLPVRFCFQTSTVKKSACCELSNAEQLSAGDGR
jgi:hypothetical protein